MAVTRRVEASIKRELYRIVNDRLSLAIALLRRVEPTLQGAHDGAKRLRQSAGLPPSDGELLIDEIRAFLAPEKKPARLSRSPGSSGSSTT